MIIEMTSENCNNTIIKLPVITEILREVVI
jgi:hypothetical protein